MNGQRDSLLMDVWIDKGKNDVKREARVVSFADFGLGSGRRTEGLVGGPRA
jgi:hypothetical protein